MRRETYLYACKIKETTNGRWRSTRGEARKALEVVTERCFAGDVQIDEQSRAAQNGQDQAQRKTDEEEAALRICRSFEAREERSLPPLHYLHHVLERLRAYLAGPGKGIIEDVDQKQNQGDRYGERSGNHVLRSDVFHSEEKGVRNGEYGAHK